MHPCGGFVDTVSLSSLARAGWLIRVVGFTRARSVGSLSSSVVKRGSLAIVVFRLTRAHAGVFGFTVQYNNIKREHHRFPSRRPSTSIGLSGVFRFCSRAAWVSFILSGVVGFTCVQPGCRWVHAGSLGSQAHALGVVGYIHVRWVHSRALCGSLVSSEVVGFTHVRLRGRWVHPA